MTAPSDIDIRQHRESAVRVHLDAENAGDIDRTVSSFARAHYDIVPLGTFDGADASTGFLQAFLTSFPDLNQQIVTLHHADAAVIVEMQNTATHRGEFAGLAPTGRSISARSCNVFLFEGGDLVGERVYFDMGTLLAQLTG